MLLSRKSGRVALIILSVFLLFTGCEQATWNDPVHQFFEYYTSTAAIVESFINRSIGSGSTGIECVESNENKTVSLVLRNPQHYPLDFTYNFDNPLVAAKAAEFSNAVQFVQSSTRDSATVVFGKEFLYAIDNGDAFYTDSLGNPTSFVKDLSGTIIVREDETKRDFGTFHISVMVNTIPPRIRGAMYQRDNSQYVICFYVPNLYGSVHEKDTKRIYIGNELYLLEFNSSGLDSITRSDGGTVNLSTTRPSSLQNVDTSGAIFQGTAPTGYVTLYYLTGLDPAAPENATVSSGLSLSDDYGFNNTVYISNTNPQLTPVTLSVQNTDSYSVEDDTGLFTFTINHDRTAYRTLMDENDPTGQATVQVPAENTPGAPTIIYNIFKVGTSLPVATGSGTAPVSVSVEKGQFYVEAYACYSGYVDSGNNSGFGSSSTNAFTVHRSVNYYVNTSGSADGNGSLYNPYNSLQKCVKEMILDTQNDYVPGATYTVKLQSNISSISTDVFDSTTDYAFASFEKSSGVSDSSIKFKIEGNNHTINAGRSSGNLGYVIKTENNVELTINNVMITGGFNSNAGGIQMDGGILNLNGVSITGNYADSGAGIHIADGTVNLNGVTVTENTLTTDGAGAGIFYEDGTVNISGRNTVDRNYNSDGTPANFYIFKNSLLNITGSVTGSLIRVSKSFAGITEPEIGSPVVFTSGFNYGTTNTDLPGKVFKGETFAVVKEGTDAAFAKSGAGIYNALDFSFDFTMATADSDGKYRFTVGQSKDFTITPVVTLNIGGATYSYTYNSTNRTLQNSTTGARYYDSDGDESQITWSAKLMCGGELTGSYAPTVNNNVITIPSALPYPETYVLHVTATYMGVPHSKDFIIYGVSN